jgi:hypothetical protein
MATNSDGGDSEDGPFWVTISAGSPSHYHASKGCSRVQRPDKYRNRDHSYVEFHDLDPCPYCHDDLSRPLDGEPGASSE